MSSAAGSTVRKMAPALVRPSEKRAPASIAAVPRASARAIDPRLHTVAASVRVSTARYFPATISTERTGAVRRVCSVPRSFSPAVRSSAA